MTLATASTTTSGATASEPPTTLLTSVSTLAAIFSPLITTDRTAGRTPEAVTATPSERKTA